MNLNQDFREFLEFLNSNEVEYLVIGGYAVAAHGHGTRRISTSGFAPPRRTPKG